MFSLISQTLLYFFGPFFCYPWKPFMNAVAGDKYAVAYKYFRRDHAHPVNLALHSICLFFQVLGNFGLLSAIDAAYPVKPFLPTALQSYPLPERPLSLLTVSLWCFYLLLAPAPILVTILSLSFVSGAYHFAPMISAITLEFWTIVPFSIVLIFGLFMCPAKKGSHSAAKIILIGLSWIGWLFLWKTIDDHFGGHFAHLSKELNIALVIFMVLVSASKFVPEAPAIGGGIACRLVAVLTHQPIIFLWGCAFTAPLLQGTSHKLTGETATLINHNRATTATPDSRQLKVRHEWAHV